MAFLRADGKTTDTTHQHLQMNDFEFPVPFSYVHDGYPALAVHTSSEMKGPTHPW